VKPTERDLGTAHLVDDALAVLDERAVGQKLPVLVASRSRRALRYTFVALRT
jgi:hypothetical protein